MAKSKFSSAVQHELVVVMLAWAAITKIGIQLKCVERVSCGELTNSGAGVFVQEALAAAADSTLGSSHRLAG